MISIFHPSNNKFPSFVAFCFAIHTKNSGQDERHRKYKNSSRAGKIQTILHKSYIFLHKNLSLPPQKKSENELAKTKNT